jgi:hypothetical protein
LHPEQALLAAFSAPVKAAGQGGQLKNLYNLYVYFWRWALWKVFEQGAPTPPAWSPSSRPPRSGRPAFCGMREELRRQCHDIWILDLGGEGRGSRKEENVFNIQTPVAITLALRTGHKAQDEPGAVHYVRIRGDRAAKLHALAGIQSLDSRQWEPCPTGWQDKFRPQGTGEYFESPLLTDLLPWQHSGVQFKRTWPIAPDKETLEARWKNLISSENKEKAFRSTSARSISLFYNDLKVIRISFLKQKCAFRSFDVMQCFFDERLCDRPRPELRSSCGDKQLFFASLFTQPLSAGPALTVSAAVPDLHYFRGSFGAKDIFPLIATRRQRNRTCCPASGVAGGGAGPERAGRGFCRLRLWRAGARRVHTAFPCELGTRELRVPLTHDPELFRRAVAIGRRLIWLHSYGERMVPPAERPGSFPRGAPAVCGPCPARPRGIRSGSSTSKPPRTLHVGQGESPPWRRRCSGSRFRACRWCAPG